MGSFYIPFQFVMSSIDDHIPQIFQHMYAYLKNLIFFATR